MEIKKENNFIQTNRQLTERYENNFNKENDKQAKQNLYKEEKSIAVQMNNDKSNQRMLNTIPNKNNVHYFISNENAPIKKKEMGNISLILNSYWIELVGSIALILSVIIYIYIGLIVCGLIKILFDFDIESLQSIFNAIFETIGFRWILFIIMNQNFSIGFFCLTTFSNMFKEAINKKKFYIINIIKIAIYYSLSVVFLKVIIKDKLSDYIHEKIDKIKIKKVYIKAEIHKIFDDLIEILLGFIADFLGVFNTFLDEITIGTIYIFLYHKPEGFTGKKLFYFRLLTIIPLLYIIVSLILRALHNTKVIKISIYLSFSLVHLHLLNINLYHIMYLIPKIV